MLFWEERPPVRKGLVGIKEGFGGLCRTEMKKRWFQLFRKLGACGPEGETNTAQPNRIQCVPSAMQHRRSSHVGEVGAASQRRYQVGSV